MQIRMYGIDSKQARFLTLKEKIEIHRDLSSLKESLRNVSLKPKECCIGAKMHLYWNLVFLSFKSLQGQHPPHPHPYSRFGRNILVATWLNMLKLLEGLVQYL